MPGSFILSSTRTFLLSPTPVVFLIENLANQLWRALGLTQRHDALPLAATAANGLQAHPVCGYCSLIFSTASVSVSLSSSMV